MSCSFQVSQQHFDSIGCPLDGARLYCYSGTDLHNTYSDADLTILNTNPIILNGRGDCDVYWDGSAVRFELYSNGSLIKSWDDVEDVMGTSGASKAYVDAKVATEASARSAADSAFSTAISTMGTTLTNLNTVVGDHTTSISTIGTTVTNLGTTVNTLQSTVNLIGEDVSDHIQSTSNPHSVTASQVGSYTKSEVNDITDAITTELGKCVRYTEQTLTSAEKSQARENIGSPSPYTSPLNTSTIDNTNWTIEQTNKAVDTVTTYTWTPHGQFSPSGSTSHIFYPFSSHIRYKIPESFAPESSEYMTLNLHGGSSPVTHSLTDAIHVTGYYILYFEIPDAWVSTEGNLKMVDAVWGGKTTAGTINEEWGTNPTSTQQVRQLAWNNDVITKQPSLISGYNIKTINGNSILGSGDLTVAGFGTKIAAAKSVTLEARTYTLQERLQAGWALPPHSIAWGQIRFFNIPAHTGDVYLWPVKRSNGEVVGDSQNFTVDCRTNGVHAHYNAVNNTDEYDYIDVCVGGTFTAAGTAVADSFGLNLKLK